MQSAPWPWNAGGCLAHGGGPTPASSALPRTNPDGDFWWVYTRPSGASGNDVLDAYLRITGQNTDTTFDAEFLKLDIDADGISLWREGTGGQLASAPVATADDTPYLIHAHVFRDQVVIRRGPLGQPLATVLRADNAPVQGTDRFILEASNACLVDDVNIGDGVSEYVYDALGRRIEKSAGGDTTRYIYDGARVAEEWDVPSVGGPTLSASYVYGNYIDEVLTVRRGGVNYYYHGDDMHNVVKLTDSDGQVVEGYDYGDYGTPEFYDASGALTGATASAFGNPYLFSGREWDEELGLYYYRNRYMDPGLGRFVSRDPLGLWGDPLNLGNGYTYAASNPWSLVDPFGLCSGNLEQQIAALAAQPDVSVFWAAVKGLFEFGREDAVLVTEGVSYVPVLGWGADAALFAEAYERGDRFDMFMSGIGFVPGLGDAIKAVADTGGRGIRAANAVAKAAGKADNAGVVGPLKNLSGSVEDSAATARKFNPAPRSANAPPNPKTGAGYGVNDPPVRIDGEWSDADMTRALYGRPPRGLGAPDLHHAGQMPGSGIHEIAPSQHRTNAALHPNRHNQGVTPEMRTRDRQLHWWYRAREQGADRRLPDLIYDE